MADLFERTFDDALHYSVLALGVIIILRPLKGVSTAEHGVQHDPAAPHIRQLPIIPRPVHKHLRCCMPCKKNQWQMTLEHCRQAMQASCISSSLSHFKVADGMAFSVEAREHMPHLRAVERHRRTFWE